MKFSRALPLLLLALAAKPSFAFDDSALRNSIEMDDVSTVREMIAAKKITPDTFILVHPYMSKPGMPILGLAARVASLRVVQYLISQHANLNATTEFGETPLMFASFFSDDPSDTSKYSAHELVVDALLQAGAMVDGFPHHFSPIAYAAYYGHIRLVKKLLDHGAHPDSDAVDGKCETNTALIYSAMNSHEEQARLLLERGANPRVVNSKEHDALYFAHDHNSAIEKILNCALSLKDGEKFSERCE